MADLDPDEPTTDDLAAVRHEAAEHRRQLRAVEAENAQLRERLDASDRMQDNPIGPASTTHQRGGA